MNHIDVNITITGTPQTIKRLEKLIDDDNSYLYLRLTTAIEEVVEKVIAENDQLRDEKLGIFVSESETIRRLRKMEKSAQKRNK